MFFNTNQANASLCPWNHNDKATDVFDIQQTIDTQQQQIIKKNQSISCFPSIMQKKKRRKFKLPTKSTENITKISRASTFVFTKSVPPLRTTTEAIKTNTFHMNNLIDSRQVKNKRKIEMKCKDGSQNSILALYNNSLVKIRPPPKQKKDKYQLTLYSILQKLNNSKYIQSLNTSLTKAVKITRYKKKSIINSENHLQK